jgi:hypothetical protein
MLGRHAWRRAALLALGDAGVLVGFAAIGRSSHAAAGGVAALGATLLTALPFVIAWFAVAPCAGAYRPAVHRPAVAARATLIAVLGAVPLGLLIRAIALQRAIPLSFALVSLATIAAMLLCWRVGAALIASRVLSRAGASAADGAG